MEIDSAIDRAAEAVGLRLLKPLQRHVIRSFIAGNDVFVSLPTGFGRGLVQLLFISPESLLSNPQWRDMLALPVY